MRFCVGSFCNVPLWYCKDSSFKRTLVGRNFNSNRYFWIPTPIVVPSGRHFSQKTTVPRLDTNRSRGSPTAGCIRSASCMQACKCGRFELKDLVRPCLSTLVACIPCFDDEDVTRLHREICARILIDGIGDHASAMRSYQYVASFYIAWCCVHSSDRILYSLYNLAKALTLLHHIVFLKLDMTERTSEKINNTGVNCVTPKPAHRSETKK